MSKRMAVLTLALAVSFATFATAETAKKAKSKPVKSEATAEKAARLTVLEPVKDYGEVPKGDKLTWSFLVKNTGDSDLQILAAKPGCGCTVADFDKVIKAGETGKVTAHVDTTAFTGPISKSVTIETNDPSAFSATLTIHAIVKPFVEAYPAGFVRYNLIKGESDVQTITLYSDEEDPFEIVKVETPGDWVKVNYAKIEDKTLLAQAGRPGQNQYRFDVTVGGPDAKIGPLADKIHILTNSKHQPDYFVSINGAVRPAFRIEPGFVNFGEIAPNDPSATRVITLRSNNLKAPESFSVTRVESSTPVIATTIRPTERKGEFEVTLQLGREARPGDLDGTIKIYTNDRTTPVVEVPVKAMVKSNTTAAK